jgi:hypothetical protein
MLMAISEERLQILVPRRLKRDVERRSRRAGLSLGEYVRRLIEADLNRADATLAFPFGVRPIRTGRRHGSVDHDRPER